eukprot:CAMPEP_0205897402 /NCGR_PEP_ID=MMETSP1083-20121108/25477_1 /ASSEMBLY_ACC=CAM_ASM_000430 /TAXON_ID=97485 /ORGANISM="Prymnesium parvum, Strain Texoma1" /LENGTH=102 /DNA_ID=CAMNT_0053262557 /DNA_START=167 /DNA_END=473 /DNA_ORIENTATION=+
MPGHLMRSFCSSAAHLCKLPLFEVPIANQLLVHQLPVAYPQLYAAVRAAEAALVEAVDLAVAISHIYTCLPQRAQAHPRSDGGDLSAADSAIAVGAATGRDV